MRRTVTNRLTCVNLADLQDSCVETDNLPHRIGRSGERVDAVEGRPRANEIEMKLAPKKDPRRCREAGGHIAEPASHCSEKRTLLGVHRVSRLVGTGEMADRGAPTDRAEAAETVRQPLEFAES